MGRRLPLLLLSAAVAGCDGGGATGPGGAVDLAAPWVRAGPEEVGLDAAGVAEVGDALGAFDRMRSLLVIRGGRLAYERYYGGFGPDSLADVRSVTKSVVGLLAGAALAEGSVARVDQPMGELLPNEATRLRDGDEPVTVRHLLTMTGGWDWDETTPAGYNEWIVQDDHVDALLSRPFDDPPGTRFVYNSAAVHLLARGLEEAGGEALPALADRALFGPLGIEVRWEEFGPDEVNGGSGLDLRPRDLARLGQLILQRGWSGSRQLLPTAWIREATGRQWGLLDGARPSRGTPAPLSYGYLWWIDPASDAAVAWGFGGQLLYVVPHLDLVIVTTNDWRQPAPTEFLPTLFDLVAVELVAAAG